MGRRLFPTLALAAMACGGKGNELTFTEDIRIDEADDANDPDSFGTKMCVTSNGASGTVYVLWMDNRLHPDEDKYDIWLNRSEALGDVDTWFPAPIKVNQGDGNVWNPDLFCNELGVFVVWEDDRDGVLENHQIYFNRSTDGGETFIPDDLLLETDPDGLSMSLEPKITGFGQDLFVVWYDSLNGAYDILVASSSDAGGSFRPYVRVDSDDPAGSAYSARPQIAISENGLDVWAVWEDSRDGAADIYFARSDNGGTTFKEDERLDGGDDAGSHDSFEPQLCADGSSNVYSVWHDSRNGTGRDIYMNYSASKGEDWADDALRMDSDAAAFGNSLFPVCVTDGSTLHTAWYDNRLGDESGGYDIYYRTASAGIPGNEEVRLDVGPDGNEPDGYANSLDPRIAMDNGNVVVGWRDGRGEAANGTDNGYDDLYYNYSQNGGPMEERDFRMDSMYDGDSFKVDMNLSVLGGSWLTAWTDGRNGTSDIYFQKNGVGEESKPPQREAQAAE